MFIVFFFCFLKTCSHFLNCEKNLLFLYVILEHFLYFCVILQIFYILLRNFANFYPIFRLILEFFLHFHLIFQKIALILHKIYKFDLFLRNFGKFIFYINFPKFVLFSINVSTLVSLFIIFSFFFSGLKKFIFVVLKKNLLYLYAILETLLHFCVILQSCYIYM